MYDIQQPDIIVGGHRRAKAHDFVNALFRPVFGVNLSCLQQSGHVQTKHGLAEGIGVAGNKGVVCGYF